jgi:Secretion system C-terminal sorting domain/NHL repeat
MVFILIYSNISAQNIITTIAGNHTHGYTGDGGAATAAQLGYVDYVAVDSANNLYIGDENYTIRKVNTPGIISTFAGIGDSIGYSGDGEPATAAELNNPNCLYIDKNGGIYISDLNNHRVRYIRMDSCKNIAETPILSPTGDGLRVFPNPSQGNFTLKLSAAAGEVVLVTITDAVGTTIKELETTTNKETGVKLLVGAGVYFVRAATRSGTWVAKLEVE